MYVQESLSDQPSIFLDPNTFSEDGTVALRGEKCFSIEGGAMERIRWPLVFITLCLFLRDVLF